MFLRYRLVLERLAALHGGVPWQQQQQQQQLEPW
jgi:hypothetical protein